MSDYPTYRGGDRLLLIGLAALALGGAATIVGFVVNARQALFSYLLAASWTVSVGLGALIFLQIIHVADARWPVIIRRLCETIASTLPVYAIAFVPILFGLGQIYSWTHPDPHDELLHKKLAYLNTDFFTVRTLVYFAVWTVAAALLRRWSLRQDAEPAAGAPMKALSAALLPAIALTLSFASFDWLMSLEPTWFSTMFGVYYFAGGFLAALALLTLLTWLADRARVLRGVTGHHYYALGRLLLAFTIFWAYIAFFQYMLIWIADKPEESRWFIARGHGGWAIAGIVLIVVHFVIPFFALLPYSTKRDGRYLAGVSVWLLAAHYLDLHWVVMPTLHPGRFVFHWIDLAALTALSGLGLAAGVWLYRGHAPLPERDPGLADSLRYHSV